MNTGQQLNNGRYQIIEKLGKGGMGAVYLCRDRKLSRRVAVKENVENGPEAQQQFNQEAVILARLDHPSLPTVMDYFVEPTSKNQYLVMEYIEGQDLKTILSERKQPLPEEQAIGWIDQILDAIHYMHTWRHPDTGQITPIVHRDIKPANIRLRPDGRVTLVDFGVAKFQIGRKNMTGAWGGTSPGYSPVEQYSGKADERSDIYALGATLYSLVTHRVPIKSTDRAGGETMPTPRQINPQLSANTDQVIQKAMALDASQRYSTVGEMRAALVDGRAIPEDAVTARGTGHLETDPTTETKSDTARPAHQQRDSAWTLLLGLLLLVGGIWFILSQDGLNNMIPAVPTAKEPSAVVKPAIIDSPILPSPTSQPIATHTPFAGPTSTPYIPNATATVVSSVVNETPTPIPNPIQEGRDYFEEQ